MHAETISAPTPEVSHGNHRQAHAGRWIAAAALGVLWFILCRHLSGEWSANEQYSYGWFVPFFAAFLFWLRWEDRPPAFGGKLQVRHSDGLVLRRAPSPPAGRTRPVASSKPHDRGSRNADGGLGSTISGQENSGIRSPKS